MAKQMEETLRETRGSLNTKVCDGAFAKVPLMQGTPEEMAATMQMCERLLNADQLVRQGNNEVADAFRDKTRELWTVNEDKLHVCIGDPLGGVRGDTCVGACVSTWMRYDNTSNVRTPNALASAPRTTSHHQTAHAAMQREGSVKTVATTLAISCLAHSLLGLKHPALQGASGPTAPAIAPPPGHPCMTICARARSRRPVSA